ncbi:MAG TPA: DNA-processing protein DprA [Thermoanaerobaculia bacterium]|nr:DNA-processing protein DprA [Thermoanaerobaculia bacterium]
MNDSPERDLLIALSLLPYLTPNRTRLLFEYFESAEAVCNAPSKLIQGLLSVTPEQSEEVTNPLKGTATRQRVASLRESVITRIDPAYPPLLKEIIDPPLALHVRGDASLLVKPSVAMVGSRRASPYAINAAHSLGRQLAKAGLAIVSGLARGVDAASHQAALESDAKTIAVLGTGIDVIYPRSHARLFRTIERDGVIVSEFPPGTPPKRENFPVRNRVISGLAYGTVVVEATSRSGSLITARMAAEQGREVFAVPGSIFSAGSEGTHRLIQYGAKLVHDVNDILEELPGHLHVAQTPPEEPESPLREVLALLSRDEGVHIDTLAARAKVPVAEALLELELGGWIKALPGARYVRVR